MALPAQPEAGAKGLNPFNIFRSRTAFQADPLNKAEREAHATRWAWMLTALSVLALAGLRLPFLDGPLAGEEGMFACMAVDNGDVAPEPHQALLVARIAGRDVWDAPQHPLPPYWVLIHGVRPWQKPAEFGSLTLGQKSMRARIPFAVLFCLALLAWVSLAVRRTCAGPDADHWKLILAAFLFVVSAPLMVGGSIQPQLDGSWGVLIVGLAAGSLGAAHRTTHAGQAMAACFLAGFLAAMGKTEWALAFLAACLASWMAGVLGGPSNGQRTSAQRVALSALTGLAAGSLLSLCLDWANFRDGFLLMFRFGLGSPQPWSATFALRWPWIWPLFPMLSLAVVVYCARRGCPALAILFFWGLCLSAGFLVTNWTGDFFPRYFCPALFALLCYVTAAWGSAASVPGSVPGNAPSSAPAARSSWPFAAMLLLCAGCLLNVSSLNKLRIGKAGQAALICHPDTDRAELARAYEEFYARRNEFSAQGSVPLTNSVYGYYFPDADFSTKQNLAAVP